MITRKDLEEALPEKAPTHEVCSEENTHGPTANLKWNTSAHDRQVDLFFRKLPRSKDSPLFFQLRGTEATEPDFGTRRSGSTRPTPKREQREPVLPTMVTTPALWTSYLCLRHVRVEDFPTPRVEYFLTPRVLGGADGCDGSAPEVTAREDHLRLT